MKIMKKELETLKKAKKEKIIDKILKLKKVSGISDQKYEKTLKDMMMKEFDENYD